MSTLPVGTLIEDRFEIEQIAGGGGMGTVYRAWDRLLGQTVALKVLHTQGAKPPDAARFLREARMIAELSHPGIVSYVAHGQTAEGHTYLAMEWLEGEDLRARLSRGRLSVAESLTLLRTTADALGAAHRRGIIHRDLKPGNLFLRDGRIDRITILDFGIARQLAGMPTLTKTGVAIGTPAYMAPEQARGERDIGPGVDIFTLGCVLYECLTGKPPFIAEHLMALLARILFDAAPPVRKVRPDVPEALGALLERMLAKDPSDRPADAAALLSEPALLRISQDGELPALDLQRPRSSGAPVRDNWREQRILCVIIAVPQPRSAMDVPTLDMTETDHESSFRKGIEAALAAFRAHIEWVADGSLVLALSQSESATDLAAQAARCALVLQDQWPEARIGVAMGNGLMGEKLPACDAVDRAAWMVRTQQDSRAEGGPGVWLDDLSRDLLDGRFVIARGPEGTRLLGEQLSVDETRLLLGRPTPCIGRDRELGFLDATLNHCIDESVAQAVLVTAPPGFGKSRLRHEFVRRLEARGSDIAVLLGRGDPISKGSVYGLVSEAVRRFCGMQRGDAPSAQQGKLKERLRGQLPRPDATQIIEFLGEMCGVPSTEEPSAKLRAARHNPEIMSEQISRAFVAFLRAECALRPVLLVLEDLHWGDALTVHLVDAALRDLADAPLMVLALGRPEVRDIFPKLWDSRALKEIALGGLSKKASERLAREVLGEDIGSDALGRIVEQAGGNALYLEELLRVVAEGKGDKLPETVLAMVQVRLGRLSREARRILRSGSVFGETFWRGGVLALLEEEARPEDLDGWLSALVNAEVIERRRESHFPSEPEYRFRHALMRDAAYSMLTAEDAAICHRQASLYLESAGERDAMILAEHARQGGDLERAAPFYLQAAQQAYACSDWDAVRTMAERAIACGAHGETLGRLRYLEAETYYRRLDLGASYTRFREALDLLERGSHHWCKAISGLLVIAPLLGELSHFVEMVFLVQTTQPTLDARQTYVQTATFLTLMLTMTGQRTPIHALLQRAEEVGEALMAESSSVRAFMTWARCAYVYALIPDPWRARALAEECVSAFTEAEDMAMLATGPLVWLGLAQAALGERTVAEQTFRRGLTLAMNRGDLMTCALHKLCLVRLWVWPDGQSDPAHADEARALTRDVLELEGSGPGILGRAHAVFARLLLSDGDLAGAEAQARLALEMLATEPILQTGYMPTLIYALLMQGRLAEAKVVAKQGIALVEAMGGTGATEVGLRISAAIAFDAAGDRSAAEHAFREARRQVQIRADAIPDPLARERYLTEVPENVKTLSLARAFAVDP